MTNFLLHSALLHEPYSLPHKPAQTPPSVLVPQTPASVQSRQRQPPHPRPRPKLKVIAARNYHSMEQFRLGDCPPLLLQLRSPLQPPQQPLDNLPNPKHWPDDRDRQQIAIPILRMWHDEELEGWNEKYG